MQMIALRNEFTAFSRRADAKIALLKEVIERVQKGEEVDVKGLLGTGDPEKEKEWEQVIQEIEEEDRLWQNKARRREQREINKKAKTDKEDSFKKLRSRVGRCMENKSGLRPPQIDEAGKILRILTRDWLELLAGSEGFLVDSRRAGLEKYQVAWGEMDSMNYAKYHDAGHRREWEELTSPRGNGMILRSIKTDFKFPMTWPDRITVLHKLRAPPIVSSDSFMLDVLILSERFQRAAARCVEDIVLYDYRGSRKTPLPPFMLEQFGKTWQLQEEAKSKNGAKINELLERVQRLEERSSDN
ncbi:MAG: hypothetical protein Q9219_002748 [cf. Caloplaca sp. 3 TL-2023]